MNFLFYPLKYLLLVNEDGKRLWARNAIALVVLATLLSVPFICFSGNYFGERGFLDRFGAFCGVLTGFYIAALVGIASFSGSLSSLDDEIYEGKILQSAGSKDGLTRREYVSAIFGYLSFMSFLLSVVAILFVVSADAAQKIFPWWVSVVAIVSFNICVAHMMVTTSHGLYYLIERLYYQEPKLIDKDD
ncbi:hypothetical protein NKJ23_28585 [Mesorhizobium sp. M0184]|uniref:hypothetical protein n=1 Tax=Mesorhizobium sp. M0184 TaxID=2956906 RepID=UPI00333D4901